MLELKAKGEEHPKTLVLVTDDSDGELDRINEIMDQAEVADDDPERGWFNEHSADQFREGVDIPADWSMDFIELLSNDWPQVEEVVDAQRREAMEAVEKSQGGE